MSSSEGFVGRQDDRERLHDALAAVAGGRGRAVAVEGEPGIGKSSLLEAALTGIRALGCDVAWAAADELTQQFPLRVLLDALGVSGRPSGEYEEVDRCRVEIAAILRGRPGGLLSDGDPVQAASELLVQLVERWCAARPLVLVLDDLQWADDASLAVWLRLTEMVDQLPLLLVAAYRPVPRRPAIEQLGDAGPAILTPGPLTTAETNELLTGLLGDAPDAELSQLAQRAAGNPMYLRELAGSMRAGEPPDSLAAALARRLDFLTPDVAEVLRVGSLLGAQFTAADVAVVLDRPVTALEPLVDEAVTAGVLVRASDRLTFRHALIRQALYDGLPNGVRLALHGHAAQALANVGA